MVAHNFLLEGLLRCGACGSMMVLAKLLDAIESGECDGDLSLIRRRLRDREMELEELRARRTELTAKRDGIRREVLDAQTVTEAYRRIPHLLSEAQRVGARDELRGLIQALLDVVEWTPKQ